MKLALPIAVAIAGTTSLLGACATDSGYMAYTGKNQPIGPCRYEKRLGSNLKKTRCEPARDDSGKLDMIGTVER